MFKVIRIGSRKSKLAIAQAKILIQELKRKYPQQKFVLQTILTTGDKLKEKSLKSLLEKGLFVKELEKALLDGTIDMAIHSAKDLPVKMTEGLEIPCILKRGNPYDVLISKGNQKLKDLPRGARIGTSSLRRTAQIKHLRPDLLFMPLRGNVETRIQKLARENLDGIILAYAGVARLGLKKEISEVLKILPAPGQGALAVEIRTDNASVRQMVLRINHKKSFYETVAERSFLQRLGGGCNMPVACLAHTLKDKIILEGLVLSLDGAVLLRYKLAGLAHQAKELGQRLADILIAKGADKILCS